MPDLPTITAFLIAVPPVIYAVIKLIETIRPKRGGGGNGG